MLRLEARPASPEGADEITLAALLRTALRMRQDRLVIGEIRGDEAFELVQALNTGHDGSLATIHANSAVEAIARLESLVVRGHATWPLAAVREQIHRSIDAVIHLDRDCNGRRRIVSVIELMPPEHEQRMRTLVSGDTVVARPTRRRR